MDDHVHAYYAKPKFSIWRYLGFGEASAPRPEVLDENPDWAPGWFIVGTRAHLGWRERLRVMVSGNIHVEQAVKTDVPIARSMSTSAVRILPPQDHELKRHAKLAKSGPPPAAPPPPSK